MTAVTVTIRPLSLFTELIPLQAYFSASADRFLIVTGAYERDSSCITLWDAIPYGHGSKGMCSSYGTSIVV